MGRMTSFLVQPLDLVATLIVVHALKPLVVDKLLLQPQRQLRVRLRVLQRAADQYRPRLELLF